MKKTVVGILSILYLALLPVSAQGAGSSGRWVADDVYRGINISGMTGLLLTNSAYSLRAGDFTFNAGIVSGGGFTLTPASLTIGFADHVEFGLAGKMVNTAGTTGLGDTELSFKWRFRQQTQYLPAMALGIGLMAPTSTNAAFTEVNNWGVKITGLGTSEARLTDTFYIGLYAEVQLVAIDSGTATSDNYSVVNLAGLIPMSDNNRLQGMLELSYVTGKGTASLGVVDGLTAMPGVRYASQHFKLTAGVQVDSASNTRAMMTLAVEI